MRATNVFGTFVVGIAMVQGVPLRTDMSSSLSHDRASEHPYDLDSVALGTGVDLKKEPGDGSNIILDTRAKSSSKSKPTGSKSSGKSTGSKSPGKSTGSKPPGKSTGSKPPGKSSGSKSSGKSSGSKSSGKSTGSKSSKSNSSKSPAAQDGNGSSTAQENDDGDSEEQDALSPSTENTAGSSEEDTEQDIQDAPEDDAEEDLSAVSDQDTEEDSQDLSGDDTEGLNDDDSDDSGIQSSGGDPDDTIPEQEISVRNFNNTSGNFTFKLSSTVKDNRKYQRPNFLLLRDAKEQKEQRNKYSRDAETDIAVDNDASPEANREDGKEQSVGEFHEKRAVNLVGIFKSILNKLGDKGADEVASLASQDNVGENDSVGEDGNTVASIEMATRRSNVN